MNTYTLQTPIGEIHTLVIEEMKAKHLKLIQNTSISESENMIALIATLTNTAFAIIEELSISDYTAVVNMIFQNEDSSTKK